MSSLPAVLPGGAIELGTNPTPSYSLRGEQRNLGLEGVSWVIESSPKLQAVLSCNPNHEFIMLHLKMSKVV